ncbi:MAG TPA: YbjN domain-containing protein [Luteolibacter sp.]|nr:YbjN domain-containing protein [Luteolibacter sp.]
MRPHSRQILTVEEAFGANGWHAELVEGRDVLRAGFEAHHTRVSLIAQAHPQLNALTIVSETPMPLAAPQRAAVLELLMHANKPLTLGAFEYDLDRSMLVFRITNLFERERYDADIISSMVHCAIAELDRLVPYVATVRQTPEDLLADLDLQRLLQREDLIPPVVGQDNMEEEEY